MSPEGNLRPSEIYESHDRSRLFLKPHHSIVIVQAGHLASGELLKRSLYLASKKMKKGIKPQQKVVTQMHETQIYIDNKKHGHGTTTLHFPPNGKKNFVFCLVTVCYVVLL